MEPVEEGADPSLRRMQLAAELGRTPELSALATNFWPNARTLEEPRTIDGWIDRACDSGYHPCGTVPMGASEDPDAATDGRGRVRGVEGLRVVDASIMPVIPNGNTHAPVIMIAEKAADLIRSGS